MALHWSRLAAQTPRNMNPRLWLLALVLIILTLTSAFGAPLAEGSDAKDEEQNIRNLVNPKMVRHAAPQRPGNWRKTRRQRPRLSHKGPMPF
ncbi:apelin [Pelobates cultripes]|uniref:Apelin n=1 Tax=Pelobates cultripes TaxID=61616 RepID=A0AAD1SZU3_PELCU|nr:apelin [Pelobates cultripes]